jgi:hypothetical protein
MAVVAEAGNKVRRIAFSHSFAVDVPSAEVEATQQRNLSACLAAECTVLNTHIDRLRNGVVQASLSVRISPDWYPSFAAPVIAPPAAW